MRHQLHTFIRLMGSSEKQKVRQREMQKHRN